MTDEQIEAAANVLAGNLFGQTLSQVPCSVVPSLLSLARAALEAAERVAWRPIESAPEEGYVVLIARYPSGCGWTDQYQAWWGAGQWARWPHGFQPTHWRPLPESPQ